MLFWLRLDLKDRNQILSRPSNPYPNTQTHYYQSPKANLFAAPHSLILRNPSIPKFFQEPKPTRPLVIRRQPQTPGEAQVLKELHLKFGANKPHVSNKPQSNQVKDGDLEKIMSGLKEGGYVASTGPKYLVRKSIRPQNNNSDLRELAAGYREVCRERQA
jgi:hypothetical protein